MTLVFDGRHGFLGIGVMGLENSLMLAVVASLALIVAATFVVSLRIWRSIRARGLDRWVPAWAFPAESTPAGTLRDGPIDLFIAVCDHYEPEWGNPGTEAALAKVDRWCREFPERFQKYRDVDGRVPQHTFFFPQDQYRPEYLDRLSELVSRGYGDVDVHLHHDNDTPQGLRDKLESFRDDLHHRHGLLRRDPVTGNIVYGFIHGNWALCNSRRDGRWCGVDHEIPILLETGCYADFTFPSAPSDTQPRTINSIYYAADRPGCRASHETGVRARAGALAPADHLLMVQGPLLFDFNRRKLGLVPRVENGDLLGNHPPSAARAKLWLQAAVTVAGQPNLRFAKLHTHGCKDGNLEMLLGDPMSQFHAELAEWNRREPNFRYHYVTAWEMAQLVHLVEAGGSVQEFYSKSTAPCLSGKGRHA